MTEQPAVASNRSLALDIFRGMTVCFMIIVNTSGGPPTFSQLEHSKWHGFTPTDLVFPSFLFAVGNALSFSMKKFKAMGDGAAVARILKRTVLIFLIGYLLSWFPFFTNESGHWTFIPFANTRIFGVLGRIGLCYGAAALLIYFFSTRTVLILSALFLVGYWIVLLLFSVPGGDPLGMLTNAGYRIDNWLIGKSHMYHGEGVAFDPEGLLSTFPAIVNVIIGYYTGVYISKHGKTYEGLTKLLLWGCGFLALAWLWNLVFPINKKIWTSSFVLLTVGLDLVILSFLTYIIEFRHKVKWTSFFAVLGKNPLFVYIVSETLIVIFFLIPVGDQDFAGWSAKGIRSIVPGEFGSLLFAVLYMLICWSVGKILDKKKIYIRV
jgi:predicted acyltransferase